MIILFLKFKKKKSLIIIVIIVALDGWTSRRNESLYNYIISTPSRKEYLVALRNYSGLSHTGW